MYSILEKIKEYKLQEVIDSQKKNPLPSLIDRLTNLVAPRGFYNALRLAQSKDHFGIIAEIKKASPSKGIIREDFDVETIAKSYEKGGAVCVSVLTDSPSFQGEDSYLPLVNATVNLPILRKDFMFTEYQIFESRALGADSILLIMACLEDKQAQNLEAVAMDLGMDILVEVHDLEELNRAQKYLKSPMIGINNRNLNTFETSLEVSKTLSQSVNADKLIICESGLYTPKDLQEMKSHGMTSFLIGESLMRQKDVQEALEALLK